MKQRTIWPLILLAISMPAPAAPAQERTPGSNIAKATWSDYRDMYPQSPLCAEEEITLWTCESPQQVFSLCSSRVMTRTSGYMQYRASRNGKRTLTYPAEKKPPFGLFKYTPSANGDAWFEFTNNEYQYSLLDPLRGESSILVAGPGLSGDTMKIKCGGNQTLQLNYTMRLMYDSGVWQISGHGD